MSRAAFRKVDFAINHDPVAIAVHTANHPRTKHYQTDIWSTKPKDVTKGRHVAFLWASPDCTHFSVAKGGKPRKQNIRSLAHVVVEWARDVRPDVIMVENVAEFLGWGPLDANGLPIKARMGETFQQWKGRLELLGYVVDHRVLDASLYGAPTRRRRLFLIARCDGKPVVWPEETHGPGKLPVHTAAECIDWTLPCPSIFERKKPLAEKTLWRIAQGIKKFVLENPTPFIVRYNGDRVGQRTDEPLTTVDTANRFGLATPVLATIDHQRSQNAVASPAEPLRTTTSKARHAVISPVITKVNHGKREVRAEDVAEPLTTVTASRRGHAVIAPVLVNTRNGERTTQAARVFDVREPHRTVTAKGSQGAVVAAFLNKHYGDPQRADGGGGVVLGSEMTKPVDTITARDHHTVTTAKLAPFSKAMTKEAIEQFFERDLERLEGERLAKLLAMRNGNEPASDGSHIAEVRAFLVKYFNKGVGQRVDEPMHTVTTRHRLGLVTVEGVDYQIVDIGFRMLEPHELLRAQFGRFAEGYDMSAAKTKRDKVRLIGNSVCPEMVEALLLANGIAAIRGLVGDLFAGGGGTSAGAEAALNPGRHARRARQAA